MAKLLSRQTPAAAPRCALHLVEEMKYSVGVRMLVAGVGTLCLSVGMLVALLSHRFPIGVVVTATFAAFGLFFVLLYWAARRWGNSAEMMTMTEGGDARSHQAAPVVRALKVVVWIAVALQVVRIAIRILS
jgi:hypothetical protein